MKKCRLALVTVLMGFCTMPANAADPVLLHAAGSLRGALTDVSSEGPRVLANHGFSAPNLPER